MCSNLFSNDNLKSHLQFDDSIQNPDKGKKKRNKFFIESLTYKARDFVTSNQAKKYYLIRHKTAEIRIKTPAIYFNK